MTLAVLLATVLVAAGIGLLVRLTQRGFDYSHAELWSDLARIGRFSWLGIRYVFNWRNWRRYSWKQFRFLVEAQAQQEALAHEEI